MNAYRAAVKLYWQQKIEKHTIESRSSIGECISHPQRTGLQLKPVLRGYGPATNILSPGTVQKIKGKGLPVTCYAGREEEQTNGPTH